MEQEIASTTSRSEALKQAVRGVFAAMAADFGAQFSRQFDRVADPMAISGNTWMRRLFARIGEAEPRDVVDGYDRCVTERRPYMPSLVDLAEAIRRSMSDRTLVAEQIAEAAAPRFGGGIAGYVEAVLAPNAESSIAKRELARMREILSRPPVSREERNARLDRSLAAHNELMASAPPVRHRGQYYGCPVPGCPKPGRFSPSVGGLGASWFCLDHWRGAK